MSGHIEVEAKIIEVDFAIMDNKIRALGAELEFQKTRFTAIWMQNENGEKLRVREEWDMVKVEAKNVLVWSSGIKVAGESTPIIYDDLSNALRSYMAKWYVEISRSVKKRTSYLLNFSSSPEHPVKLVIDEYSDLDWMRIPPLLEIEIEADSNAPEIIETCKNVIVEVANLLGYSEEDLKDWSAKDLLDYYKKKSNA